VPHDRGRAGVISHQPGSLRREIVNGQLAFVRGLEDQLISVEKERAPISRSAGNPDIAGLAAAQAIFTLAQPFQPDQRQPALVAAEPVVPGCAPGLDLRFVGLGGLVGQVRCHGPRRNQRGKRREQKQKSHAPHGGDAEAGGQESHLTRP